MEKTAGEDFGGAVADMSPRGCEERFRAGCVGIWTVFLVLLSVYLKGCT
jgi:hypothetical protein